MVRFSLLGWYFAGLLLWLGLLFVVYFVVFGLRLVTALSCGGCWLV